MQDFIRSYWPIIVTITTLIIAVVGLFFRVDAIEERQDRQGEAIAELRAQIAIQAAQYAELNAKIDALGDNVTYIRARIDRALP